MKKDVDVKVIKGIVALIKEQGIYEFARLVDYLVLSDEDLYLDIVYRNPAFFTGYLSSRLICDRFIVDSDNASDYII